MKRTFLLALIFSLAGFVFYQNFETLFARGGGRGGFGGAERGGFDRERPEFQSRPLERRPSESLDHFHSPDELRNVQRRPFEESHAATSTQVQQFLQGSERPLQNTALRSTDLQNRSEIGDTLRTRNDALNWNHYFTPSFWEEHTDHYPFHEEANWWRGATWYGAASWLADPIYGEPVYYDNDYAYPVEPQQSTSQNGNGSTQQQTSTQTTVTQAGTDGGIQQNAQWLPLGVFALTKELKNVPPPNMFMQLALNKSGAIGGNLYDKEYNKTFPLVGKVDLKTQRVVWKMSNSQNSPYLETGLYNLTKSETPVKITYADGTTQKAFLVKIESMPGGSK